MDASDGTSTQARLRPVMSTQVAPADPGDTRPSYILHAVGVDVPNRAPACRPDCTVCQEHPR